MSKEKEPTILDYLLLAGGLVLILIVIFMAITYDWDGSNPDVPVTPSLSGAVWECEKEEQNGWEYFESGHYRFEDYPYTDFSKFECLKSKPVYTSDNSLGQPVEIKCVLGRVPVMQCVQEKLVRKAKK